MALLEITLGKTQNYLKSHFNAHYLWTLKCITNWLCMGLVEKPNTLFDKSQRKIIGLKKYCKNIDITDRILISCATKKCLEGKYKRNDTLELFQLHSQMPKNQIYYIIHRFGTNAVQWIVEDIITTIQNEIFNWDIHFVPIWYKDKIDQSSGKIRHIGIQNIKQQIYDYIAVEGLKPFLCRIGEYQCASIKGRGQKYGIKAISKWMRNKKIKYVAQADIRKCYENISHEKIMIFLNRHIKNNLLLRLISLLIDTFKNGLSIGSYLSQFLCNLYLSELYHEISENMYKIRKTKNGGQRENYVVNVLFFMDDILLLGRNKKYLHSAINLIKNKLYDMGLNIKDSWKIFKARIRDKDKNGQFIDIMGYKIYRSHITIRRRVFKRLRKAYAKALKAIKTRSLLSIKLARRCLSYYGYIKNTNSYKLYKKYKVYQIKKACTKVVKIYDKSKNRSKTRSSSY